jgi:tetratricopeptide (TPR) repeat protein
MYWTYAWRTGMLAPMNPRPLLALLAILLATPVLAHEEQVGKVSFPTSCDPAVQPLVERGVALLHSFWFPEGLKTFNEVLKRDPSCTIAYWGIGVNRLLNPFGGQVADAVALQGQEAVEKGLALAPKTDGANTQRERDYLAAIAAFYGRDGAPFRERAQRYEQAMEKLAAKYPQDREAAIFYALALNIAADPMDKTYARPLKAARILEPIFREQPEHPGVAHYLIHSYDYPPIADKGLPAARRYADIAPDAAHALHMPSHVFTRVGAWEDSLATNRRSEDNALRNKSAQDMLHAIDYQAYAALQLARDGEAREMMQRMHALPPNADQRSSYYALAAVPARYALERGDWRAATALEVTTTQFLYTPALTHFARGYGAARLGDAASAEREAGELDKLRQTLAAKNDKYWATEVEVQRLAVLAWAELARGDEAGAVGTMRKAAELEEASEKAPVSPGRLLPAREILGEMLLETGRAKEALVQFEASAVRDPNRFRGYYGAALAAQRSGDMAKARDYFARLQSLAAKGDPRPELAKARAAAY